jgi:hypothetical protein
MIAMTAHSIFSHIVDKFAADVEKTCSDLIIEIVDRQDRAEEPEEEIAEETGTETPEGTGTETPEGTETKTPEGTGHEA